MNKDIRINVGFFQHHKTKKLIYRLDHKGVTALLSLWTYAAQNKPKGILTNMDKVDISLSACWEGDSSQFVDTLVDIGFLEDNGGVYAIHDWEKNNPYAFHADERSEHARKAARARWGDTGSIQEGCSDHARSNAPPPVPIPSPEPKPKPKKKRFKPPTIIEVQDFIKEKGYSVDATRFVSFYASKGWMVGKNKMKDWKQAITGWHTRNANEPDKPAFEQGENNYPEGIEVRND